MSQNPTLFDLVKMVCAFVRDTIEANPQVKPDSAGITKDRAVVMCLQMAWADSVRGEFYNYMKTSPYKAEHAVAIKLMKSDRYSDGESEPICGLPGQKARVCVVDGKECICFDHSMSVVTPLSAIYLQKVLEAREIARDIGDSDRVEKLKTAIQYVLDDEPSGIPRASSETRDHLRSVLTDAAEQSTAKEN